MPEPGVGRAEPALRAGARRARAGGPHTRTDRVRAVSGADAPALRQEPGHAAPADGGARSARPRWAPAPSPEPRPAGVRPRRVPALMPATPERGRGLAALAGARQRALGQGQGPPPASRQGRALPTWWPRP
jgi:hypothetical protein